MIGSKDFIDGLMTPLAGLRLLFSSGRLFLLALIPFVIGIALFAYGVYWATNTINPWVESWVGGMDWLANWEAISGLLGWLVSMIVWLAATLINFLLGYIVVMLIAGPFYALMVEEVFRQRYPAGLDKAGLKLMVSMFLTAIAKTFLFLFVGFFCFVLSFFPGINLLVGFIVFAMVAFDCSDYCFEVDALSLRQRFVYFFKNLSFFAGLTIAIFITSFVPGSFFVLLPAFICGATEMYIQRQYQSV